MRHALHPTLLLSLLACSSVDNAKPGGRESVQAAITAGIELGQGVTLRAGTCTRVGDVYEMNHIEIESPDGNSSQAPFGTIASNGMVWEITLFNVDVAGRGYAETIVLRTPDPGNALTNQATQPTAPCAAADHHRR